MTQEFHISVTPIGHNDYLVRTEQVAPGVPLAEELVTWPVADWLTAASHLMNDPLKSVLQEDAMVRNSVNLAALGQQLYNELFQGTLRDSWITAQGIAQNHQQVLHLRLGIKDNRLARLPWEVMHAGDRPIATVPSYISFSRYQIGIAGASRLPTTSMLIPPDEDGIRVLMVIASPFDMVRLDLLKQEAIKLQAELHRQISSITEGGHFLPEIELHLLEQPGREELTQGLEQGRYHILHYSGHSNLGANGGEIYLVNHRTGLTETLSGDDLAGLLVNNNIQIAVFNSCLGAYGASVANVETGMQSLTESLVKRGICGVLAMSEEIPAEVAITLTQLFYRNLRQGYPIHLCVSRVRQGLITAYGSHQMYWALPILYLQSEFDGNLSPRAYLPQNTELLPEYEQPNLSGTEELFDDIVNSSSNPFLPLSGRIENSQQFFDRKQELKIIFEILNSASSVALIGEQGIGKSSLLWAIYQQATKRLTSPRKAIYLNLSDIFDENDFYEALCYELGIETCKGFKLTRTLRQQGLKILLLLDEAGKITSNIFIRLHEQLRSLAEGNDPPLRLVIASIPVNKLSSNDTELGIEFPLERILIKITISRWDESTSHEFIVQRLKSCSIQFEEKDITQIIKASSGHPKELMQLCYQAYNRYCHKLEDRPKDTIIIRTPLRYYLWLNISENNLILSQEIEVNFYQSSTNKNSSYLLEIFEEEAIANELNIILNAPGFQINGDNTASLPLDPDIDQETQTVRFRLTALRSGKATITAELYRGDTFETKLETQIQVNDIDETTFIPQGITTQPRPLPQADFILRIQTIRNQTNSTCKFQYQLRSFQFFSIFPGNDIYTSNIHSAIWVEQVWGLLATVIENTSDSLPQEEKSSLISFGKYLFNHLFPTDLQNDIRSLIPQNSTFTLLILADQDASMPWELLHDGQRFFAERFIIGRWLQELNDTRPYDFPVGAVNVAHYANAQQPELWATLLEAPGAPPPQPLPEGVLHDSTEAIRGLHLVRYSQPAKMAKLSDAPVRLDDMNDAEDIEGKIRSAKLNLRRHHPFITLSYVKTDIPELAELEKTWASAFIWAGCSGFTSSLWAVEPSVEAAFTGSFYNQLWTGASLGEAFDISRQLARAVAPDSLDWLAYVLFGDPMARPYLPAEGKGYAVVEPIGQDIDEAMPVGVPLRFRLSLRRTPPVWHEERIMEVSPDLRFENLQVHVNAFGLEVAPNSPIDMNLVPTGDYLGWVTLTAPPESAGNSIFVEVSFMDGAQPIDNLIFSLDIANDGGEVA